MSRKQQMATTNLIQQIIENILIKKMGTEKMEQEIINLICLPRKSPRL